jgi:hypothetical protein
MDKKQTIKDLETTLNKKVKSYEIIDDNNSFMNLKENIEGYLNNYNLVNDIKIEYSKNESVSFQKTDEGLILTLHNSISISTQDGISLRFYPHLLDGLELCFDFNNISLEVNKNKLVLLNIFFEFVRKILKNVPTIFIREIDFEYNT